MKTLKLATLMSCCLFMVCSCSKLSPEQDVYVARDMELTCGVVDAASKTALAGSVSSIWLQSDCISVFDGTSNCKFTSTGTGPSVAFTGKAAAVSTYYALYPYNSTASCNAGVINTTVPRIQTATKGSYPDGTMVMAASFTGNSVTFRNQLAVFKLTVPEGVASIKIEGYNQIAFTGDCTVNLNESTCYATANNYPDVILCNPDGSVLSQGTYYICVIPTVISAGMKLTLTGGGKYAGKQIIKSTSNYRELHGGTIYNLGAVSADWKVIPGAGVTANFSRGMNIEGSFEVGKGCDASNIWMEYFSDKDFGYMSSIGCDVVRVPMQLGYFIDNVNTYHLQDLFFTRLDQAIAIAEKYDMSIIIDNHLWELYDKQGYQYACLKSIWEQIANHCKNMSNKVVYELLNEPDGTYWHDNWHSVQSALINDIRAIDTKHTIIVTPTNYCRISDMPTDGGYADKNLLYSYHSYFPYEFTHQGFDMGPAASIGGMLHFPYQSGDEQAAQYVTDPEVKANVQNYASRGTVSALHEDLLTDLNTCNERGLKLFVGEFGTAWMYGMDQSSRENWLRNITSFMDVNGVAWTHWCYTHDFGIYNNGSYPVIYTNPPTYINSGVVTALGLGPNSKKTKTGTGTVSDFAQVTFEW